MMDRGKKDKLPEMQIGFIDGICLPVYQVWKNAHFLKTTALKYMHPL